MLSVSGKVPELISFLQDRKVGREVFLYPNFGHRTPKSKWELVLPHRPSPSKSQWHPGMFKLKFQTCLEEFAAPHECFLAWIMIHDDNKNNQQGRRPHHHRHHHHHHRHHRSHAHNYDSDGNDQSCLITDDDKNNLTTVTT